MNNSGIVFINEKSRIGSSEGKKGIRVNLENDSRNRKGEWSSTFHEIGHRVDRILGRPSTKLEKLIRE